MFCIGESFHKQWQWVLRCVFCLFVCLLFFVWVVFLTNRKDSGVIWLVHNKCDGKKIIVMPSSSPPLPPPPPPPARRRPGPANITTQLRHCCSLLLMYYMYFIMFKIFLVKCILRTKTNIWLTVPTYRQT